MKIDTNKLNVSKKHLIAIAVIVAAGVLLGIAILGGKATKTAEDDGHGHGSHVEAKAHSGRNGKAHRLDLAQINMQVVGTVRQLKFPNA